MMDGLIRGESVSPADFTLSVHHALAGLLSIAQNNRRGHVAVAAGGETFFCGLMEAAACLAADAGDPVVLVYYDEPLCDPFDEFDEPDAETLALALTLEAHEAGAGVRLSATPAPAGAVTASRPGEAFLRFLLTGVAETTLVGERQAWRLVKTDAPAS